jgi:hypothetical protein
MQLDPEFADFSSFTVISIRHLFILCSDLLGRMPYSRGSTLDAAGSGIC